MRNKHKEKDGELYYNEWSVSFVGEDNYQPCLNAGIQSVNADFRTALDMIEDVISHWPQDPEEQKKLYKTNVRVFVA